LIGAFERGQQDILIVEQEPVPKLAGAISTARVVNTKGIVSSEDVDFKVTAAMAELALECPAFAERVIQLVRSFLAQFNRDTVTLRIETVNKATCPKFHCDNVRMRMFCTFLGPGTEYVLNDAPDDIRRAPTFSLVFLKGKKHLKHADTVHHRSPAVSPDDKRLCVVLDY
jgi:hypothetical protein